MTSKNVMGIWSSIEPMSLVNRFKILPKKMDNDKSNTLVFLYSIGKGIPTGLRSKNKRGALITA